MSDHCAVAAAAFTVIVLVAMLLLVSPSLTAKSRVRSPVVGVGAVFS